MHANCLTWIKPAFGKFHPLQNHKDILDARAQRRL
jgi:hypothetical protein